MSRRGPGLNGLKQAAWRPGSAVQLLESNRIKWLYSDI
jgi:hypothetical protein